jgi:acetyltransferase-like isoleucine patch superfamily enzyme
MIIGRLQIRGGTRVHLGDQVRVRKIVRITGGGKLRVGPGTLLNGPWIVTSEQVTIGQDCLISDCGISDNDFHNLQPQRRHDMPTPQTKAAVHIGKNVWVGLSALVLKGSVIGDNSAVGAAAVVRNVIEPNVVVTGDPAEIVKRFE